MRGGRSALVIAAVALLGVVAVGDALRGSIGRGEAGARAQERPAPMDPVAVPRAELTAAGLRGDIAYTDSLCRRWRVELPSAERRIVSGRWRCPSGSRVEPSPRGTWLATARADGETTIRDRTGRTVTPPGLSGDPQGDRRFSSVYDVAWSSDERWVAFATRRYVLFVRIGAEGAQPIRLQAEARDLSWG